MSFLNFVSDVSSLSCVNRFSQSHMAKKENVLEHSGFVALISMFIGYELIHNGCNVSIGNLLSKALMHDFEETRTGDIVRPMKHFNPNINNVIQETEKSIMLDICRKYSNGQIFYELWDNAKGGIEGQIVSIADMIAALYKFHDEIVLRGNKTMLKIYNDTIINRIEDRLFALSCDFTQLMNVDKALGAILSDCQELAMEIGEI